MNRQAILEVLNNHKMDAPEDVLVFAIEDVPAVVDAILNSLIEMPICQRCPNCWTVMMNHDEYLKELPALKTEIARQLWEEYTKEYEMWFSFEKGEPAPTFSDWLDNG